MKGSRTFEYREGKFYESKVILQVKGNWIRKSGREILVVRNLSSTFVIKGKVSRVNGKTCSVPLL